MDATQEFLRSYESEMWSMQVSLPGIRRAQHSAVVPLRVWGLGFRHKPQRNTPQMPQPCSACPKLNPKS